MKQYLISIYFLLAVGVDAMAQNSLSGKITDKATGAPLQGATVYIPHLKLGATADSNGNYAINNMPAGKYLVEVRYLAYNTSLQTIDIQKNTITNFALDESVVESHEVVITGVSKATELRQNPVPALIVPKLILYQQSSTNIIDAIARQPGISQLSTGAAISKPVIRGLGYNRVVTLNNGLRQEGQQWGDEHGIEIDEYSIDRVEIIKGPGSLLYGSDAMAGVINLLAPKPVDNSKIMGEVLANYQTNNNLIGLSGMVAGNQKSINWLVRVSSKQAAAYQNKYDGRVFNSGFNEVNFSSMAGINKKWGHSQLSISAFNQNIGMTEGERDSLGWFTREVAGSDTSVGVITVHQNELTTHKLFVPRQQVNHYRASLQNLFILGKSNLAVNVSYQQNHRREYGNALMPNQYQPYFFLQTLGYDIKYYLPDIKGWETTVGLNGMAQDNKNNGTEFIIPDYNLFDYGIFVITKKTIKKLNLSGGARFDRRLLQSKELFMDSVLRFKGFERSFDNFSGSVGATYNFTRRFLTKLNISRGFRAPNIAELASNGKHEGALRYEYGNNGLRPETSLQVDIGISYASKHVTVDASVFRNTIRNYITQEKLVLKNGSDSIPDPTDPVPAYLYVQTGALLLGYEIVIDFHPHPWDWLHFQQSFSLMEGINTFTNRDSSNYLPFMPPPRYQAELRASFKKTGKHISAPYLFAQLDYTFAQNKIGYTNNFETKTPGYSLVNAGAGTSINNKRGNAWLNIYLTGNNLFDVAYQSHLSRLKYAAVNSLTGRTGVFNMGRNFSIKIIFHFESRK